MTIPQSSSDEGAQRASGPLLPKRILHFSRLRRVCFFSAICMRGKALSLFLKLAQNEKILICAAAAYDSAANSQMILLNFIGKTVFNSH